MLSVGINGNLAGTLLASYYKGTGMRCGRERDVVMCASSGQSHAEILRELSPTLNCASEQPYVVRPGDAEQEQPIVTHPQIAGTLCASGAGLSRPAGQGNELDFCVVSAGFKHKAGSQSGSIGFQEETAHPSDGPAERRDESLCDRRLPFWRDALGQSQKRLL